MPSLKIICLLVLEKEIFKDFFSIYGHGGHLGHVTWTIYTNFASPSQGGSTYNLASIGQVVSEKKTFENGGRRQRRPLAQVSLKSNCSLLREIRQTVNCLIHGETARKRGYFSRFSAKLIIITKELGKIKLCLCSTVKKTRIKRCFTAKLRLF